LLQFIEFFFFFKKKKKKNSHISHCMPPAMEMDLLVCLNV
jgi:hypothetical protein